MVLILVWEVCLLLDFWLDVYYQDETLLTYQLST